MGPGNAKSAVAIRRLLRSDWPAYRDLRLAALRTDPLAFGSTLDAEEKFTEERWNESAARASISKKEATFVASIRSKQLVGMCGTFPEGELFLVWGMWVNPEFRGQGIGGRLLDQVLRWIDSESPGSTVALDVNPVQAEAVRVYQARGFVFEGEARPLGHHAPAMRRRMVRRSSEPRRPGFVHGS